MPIVYMLLGIGMKNLDCIMKHIVVGVSAVLPLLKKKPPVKPVKEKITNAPVAEGIQHQTSNLARLYGRT